MTEVYCAELDTDAPVHSDVFYRYLPICSMKRLRFGMNQTEAPPMPYSKERKYRRFELQLPVWLSFPSAGFVHKLEGISKNVSMGGVLVKASDHVPTRTQVSLTMDVRGPRLRRPVRLLGEGEVVRVERLEAGAGFAIAIECRRPIAEIENPAIG